MENFNFKKYLAEGKLLKEQLTPDVEDYLIGLYDLFSSEGYEEGKEINNIISKEEFGDPEAYDDADMFDKAYNEIKQQDGSVTIEGQPNIKFSLKGEDIIMNYTTPFQAVRLINPNDFAPFIKSNPALNTIKDEDTGKYNIYLYGDLVGHFTPKHSKIDFEKGSRFAKISDDYTWDRNYNTPLSGEIGL
jgi:hypothetical protein